MKALSQERVLKWGLQAVGRARELLCYKGLLPTLENMIIDQHDRLFPNILATTGLKLVLLNESIPQREFK